MPSQFANYCKFYEQVRKVLWTWREVRATVVTAGHCMHAELTSGRALAAVACTPVVCAN